MVRANLMTCKRLFTNCDGAREALSAQSFIFRHYSRTLTDPEPFYRHDPSSEEKRRCADIHLYVPSAHKTENVNTESAIGIVAYGTRTASV